MTKQTANQIFQAIQTLGAATRYVTNDSEVITLDCQNPTMIANAKSGIIGVHLHTRFAGGISFDKSGLATVNTIELKNVRPDLVAVHARLFVAIAECAKAIEESML